jgi:phosphoglycolate phosphatase
VSVPALLFDLDGCLVDSLPSIVRCWERTLPRFGAPPPAGEVVRHLAGPPVDDVARRLLPDAPPDRIAEVVAAYRRCSAADAGSVPAYPGVVEMLTTLGTRGVRLGIATSKSIEVAERVLAALGLRDHFDVVEGTPADALGTDKATVVARALEALAPDVPIGLVGDRSHDIVGAHAHGLGGFGALWGYGGRAELESAGAAGLFEAPADVLTLALV